MRTANVSKLSLTTNIREARPLTSGKVRDPRRESATKFYQDNLDVRLSASKRRVDKYVPSVGISQNRIPILLGRPAKLQIREPNNG